MARIPEITSKEALSPEHHGIFDAIAASRGAVRGPFALLMNSPELAGRIAHVGAYVRFESSLPAAVRELAVTAMARELECAYELNAHLSLAKEVGVGDAVVQAVVELAPLDRFSADDALVIGYVRELSREHRVSEKTFAAAVERFGVPGITELTATLGYYAMIGHCLNAFQDPSDR